MGAVLTRRRFITVSAAAAGLPLLSRKGMAVADAKLIEWNGQALGAPASLLLHHHDRRQAERLVEAVVAEISRLERVFSLYRRDSALSGLNRTGVLLNPPPELLDLLAACGRFHALTDGAFDPTLQPLWLLYARHFSLANPDPAGPSKTAIRNELKKVGFDQVRFSRDRVGFETAGMALTLNGIAQGYITDRVVEMLRLGGIASSLVDMGEIGAIGHRPDGSSWRVGVSDGADGGVRLSIDLVDKAIATSSRNGFCFDRAGRFSHLLDPRTGAAASAYGSIIVVAPDATTADALSTAFHVMPMDGIAKIEASDPALRVYRFDALR